MAKKGKDKSCCTPTDIGVGCCKVESLISVDERGQMILPKEIRDRANIRAGNKLAAVSWEKNGDKKAKKESKWPTKIFINEFIV